MNGKYIYDINSPPFVPSVNSGRALSPVEGVREGLQQPAGLASGAHRLVGHQEWESGLIFPVLDLALKPAHFPDQS